MNVRFKILTFAAVLLLSSATARAGWEEGISAFQARNYAQAVEEFRGVVEAQPDWPGGHRMLGQSLLKLGRSQEALTHLRKAYDLGPDDVAIQLILGQAYVQTGRYRDAAELLGGINAASLPKDNQAALHQLRSVALDRTGQPSSALQEMGRAVAINPNSASLQYQYGTMLFNNGDTGRAVAALEKAASLDSDDPKKHKAYADALIRYAREQRGDGKESAYRKAVSAASRLVSAEASYDNLMLLGSAQLGADIYGDAVATFQRASQKNPNDWLPHFYIGQAQTVAGNYSQAERALQAAQSRTSASEDTTRIWKQLGLVYEKQKKFNEAITAYGRAGDNAAVARVQENREIAEHNTEVEKEKAEIERLKAEEEELERKLKELEGETEEPPSR